MPRFEDIEQEIDNILDCDGSALTPEQQAAADAYLEELSAQESDKIDAFCRYIRMKTATAQAKREEARRLTASAQSDENSANYLKMRYLQIMLGHGLQKVKGNAYRLSIRATPIVLIEDESILPREYIVEKVSCQPDKIRLRDDLKAGKVIPGAKMAQSFSLQVA